MELIYATQASIEAYYGAPPPASMRAMILSHKGQALACGGVMQNPTGLVAFMEWKPEALRYKKSLLKAVLAVRSHIFMRYASLYSIRDTTAETSARFLRHLGFVPINDNDEVFVWHRPQFPCS